MVEDGEGGNYTQLDKAHDEYVRQRDDAIKCQAGDETYCSYAENHPAETAAFVVGGLALAGVGGAAAAEVSLGAVKTTATTVETANIICGGDMCEDEINTGINTVYHVVEEGRTIYVGITQNFAQRAAYWLSQKGWDIAPYEGLSENLSRFDARSVEQVLIEHYGLLNLENQINSIAISNPIYQNAIPRGNDILHSIGFFGGG
jgi:hypothetical protein